MTDNEFVTYEYGAMSSRFSIQAKNKLTAYATMVCHYGTANHLVAIYAPESSTQDQWLSITGKVSERLDEIFGGHDDAFDKYVESHIDEIKECMKTIKQLC